MYRPIDGKAAEDANYTLGADYTTEDAHRARVAARRTWAWSDPAVQYDPDVR